MGFVINLRTPKWVVQLVGQPVFSDRDRAKLLALRHTPEQAAAAVGYDERGCFSPGRAARAYDAAKAATRTSRVRARAS